MSVLSFLTEAGKQLDRLFTSEIITNIYPYLGSNNCLQRVFADIYPSPGKGPEGYRLPDLAKFKYRRPPSFLGSCEKDLMIVAQGSRKEQTPILLIATHQR
jgi:hypothetical protein